MTKKDIACRIADELGSPQLETMQIVQKTLDARSRENCTLWPARVRR